MPTTHCSGPDQNAHFERPGSPQKEVIGGIRLRLTDIDEAIPSQSSQRHQGILGWSIVQGQRLKAPLLAQSCGCWQHRTNGNVSQGRGKHGLASAEPARLNPSGRLRSSRPLCDAVVRIGNGRNDTTRLDPSVLIAGSGRAIPCVACTNNSNVESVAALSSIDAKPRDGMATLWGDIPSTNAEPRSRPSA